MFIDFGDAKPDLPFIADERVLLRLQYLEKTNNVMATPCHGVASSSISATEAGCADIDFLKSASPDVVRPSWVRELLAEERA